jgi:ADP-ribose pyrophosphatase YjhB (NUDIX family)
MNLDHPWVVHVYRVLPRRVSSRLVRWLMPTYPIGVVAVVFDAADRVLVLRHTYHRPAWRLPGGLLEAQEEVLEAARREVYEEARCLVRAQQVVDARANPYTFDVAVYAELEHEEVFRPGPEVTERKWLSLPETSELPADHRRFIEAALRARHP